MACLTPEHASEGIAPIHGTRATSATGSARTRPVKEQLPNLPGITATRLTAPGRGAVASVRLSCSDSDSAQAIDSVFTAANGMAPSSAPMNRVLFGSWRGEDVVVVRTADTEWEVHCHGGEAAVSRILMECDGQEKACSLSAIEELLLQTRTTRTAPLVLAQSNGVLRDALRAIANTDTVEAFREQMDKLLQWERFARHLVEPWRVVIAGPPNVGKSSLLNAIAGYDRAIVFDRPGTTRDAVQTELFLDGWPFLFVDTAGIRQQTNDPIEALGISSARDLLATADLVLLAVDKTVGWTSDHDDIKACIPDGMVQGVVCCKSDLAPSSDVTLPDGPGVFNTAAVQGDGIRELTEWITQQLVPDVPDLGIPLPVAGVAEVGHGLLHRLDRGDSLQSVQHELRQWLRWSRC